MSVVVVAQARTRARLTGFASLLGRDLWVLRKNLPEFFARTLLQPVLLLFVFTYLFPKIGQQIGGDGELFSTRLVPGVLGLAVVIQAIQVLGLSMVLEIGFTGEIEDRVLAPTPLAAIAVGKMLSGAAQALLAALVVLPLAYVIPADPIHLHVDWPVLLTVLPASCLVAATMGMAMGTSVDFQRAPMVFAVIAVPVTFLGAVYYPWDALEAVRWVQVLVLLNPLVYINEGLRAALTDTPHLPLVAVYAGLVVFAVVLGGLALRAFSRRLLP